MKPIHVFLLCLVVSGCQCGPDTASPVKLRIRNASTSPLFVDATDGRMGLAVQRRVGEDWSDVVETPPCVCQTCDRACDDTCTCPRQDAPTRQVLMVPAGGTFEREWSGEVLVDAEATCGSTPSGSPTCLQPKVPGPGERFRLRLCYAFSAPSAGPTDGSAPVPGVLPENATVCTEQEFTISDGEVELGPKPPPPSCTQDADCEAPGALCLKNVCTLTCPANHFPPLSSDWQVYVPEPEEQGVSGFFAVTDANGRRSQQGTGTLTSVRYAYGTMTLQLSRPAQPSGDYKASLSVTLPSGVSVPLTVGERLTVRVVDATSASNPSNRALVLRDADGGLLLVADPAQDGVVLGADDTSPFTVSSLASAAGCDDTPCGKRVYALTEFRLDGFSVPLVPGDGADFAHNGVNWRVFNLTNSEQRGASCPAGRRMPYVVTNRRAAP